MKRLLVIAWSAWLLACGAQLKPEPPKSTGTGPLDRVVLLPLTQRDVNGLLGHALENDASPRRNRPVLVGEPRMTETQQHVIVVREASIGASIGVGYGPVGANASLEGMTHLAYDTTITGYAEVSPDAEYRAESDCCFNGTPDEGCSFGYVSRAVRGTGAIKYLQQSTSEVSVEGGDVFQARDGSRYRVLETYTFEDAYFAFEVGDPEELCRLYGDEATFEPLEVRPNPNCRIMAHDVNGLAASHALYLMTATDCRVVAADYCNRIEHCIRCSGRYDNGEAHDHFTLPHHASARVLDAERTAQQARIVDAPAPAAAAPPTSDATVDAVPDAAPGSSAASSPPSAPPVSPR